MLTYKLPLQSEKKNFIFNMMGSLTNAAVSVLLLIMVRYITGTIAADLFSVSYSTAQMMYTFCVFEIRNIQAIDVKRKFSFSNIVSFRIITTIAAWLFFIIFACVRGYNGQRFYVNGALVAYMSVLSLSDLFQGNMHLNGYLSLAGKSLMFEVLIAATVFLIALLFTKNLTLAVLIMFLAVLVWVFLYDIPFNNNFDKFKAQFDFTIQKKIFLCALPLFLSSFMHQYIFNAPKYAIESVLSNEGQAHYGYLVMPVFCINLLSIFVFRPQLITLSKYWIEKRLENFKKTVGRLYFWVVLITAVALICGYLLGIPVLELLYGADLSGKRSIFMVLLLAGGFSAASTLTLTLFTTMTKQKFCLIAYSVTMIFALFAPRLMTKTWGLMGAAVSYLCEMALLFILMFILFIVSINKRQD